MNSITGLSTDETVGRFWDFNSGALTVQGTDQMIDVGNKFSDMYPSLFEDNRYMKIFTDSYQRTVQSAAAFLKVPYISNISSFFASSQQPSLIGLGLRSLAEQSLLNRVVPVQFLCALPSSLRFGRSLMSLTRSRL